MKINAETFKTLKRRVSELDTEFEPFRTKGAQIQQFVCPWRGRFLTGESENEDRGELFNDESIHNTVTFEAIDVMAAGIKNGISPSSRPWFRVGAEDSRLAELGASAVWLSQVERLFYQIFHRSNIYRHLQGYYAELGVFSTGACVVLPDYRNVIRAKTMSFGEYRLGMDYREELNTFSRRFYKTVGQLVEEFGNENVTDETLVKYTDGHLDQKILCQCLIEPNDDRVDVKDALSRNVRSIYWEVGANEDSILGVRGFDEFPVIGGVWDSVGGMVYGIGPGHKNLRNCMRLQKLEADSLQNLALSIAPPLVTDSANKDVMVDGSPWGITRSNESPQHTRAGIRQLYEQKALTRDLEYKIERNEKAIRDGFYNQIFLMISNSAENIKTAYQAARMLEEKYSILGPVFEQSQQTLSQLFQLTFAYALDAGLIPEAPPELQGSDLKIEYTSILAQAQKIAGLQAINDTFGYVSTVSRIYPEARHKFDALQSIDEVAQVNGAPPSIIRSDDEVAARIAEERKAQQATAAGEAMLAATQGAKNLNGVQMGGRDAIDVLTGAAGNG